MKTFLNVLDGIVVVFVCLLCMILMAFDSGSLTVKVKGETQHEIWGVEFTTDDEYDLDKLSYVIQAVDSGFTVEEVNLH